VRVVRPQRVRPAPLCAFIASLTVALVSPGLALAEGFKRDETPLPKGLTDAAEAAPSQVSGGSYLRLVAGLAIVIALIYAIYKLLRRSNRSGLPGRGDTIAVLATAPLGPSRAVHLVRVGPELLLVGSAEQSVTGLRVYNAEEAADLFSDLDGAAGPFTPTGGGRGVAAALDDLRRRTARR
jgi:flagellar biogenesis protein FliO